jgi:hypothetical protein
MDTYVPEEHIIQSENLTEEEEEEEEVELGNTSVNLVTTYDRFVKSEEITKRKHPQSSQLPETITILKDDITNGTIYLVGTAHFRFIYLIHFYFKYFFSYFSEKSQREVAEVCFDIILFEIIFNYISKDNSNNSTRYCYG